MASLHDGDGAHLTREKFVRRCLRSLVVIVTVVKNQIGRVEFEVGLMV
jgi:hypothetical protein